MKNIIVILLLGCLVFPFAGSYLFIHFKKNKIRQEVSSFIDQGVKENDLIFLQFNKEEAATVLNWKNVHEFEYDGRMFDIVEQSREGDSVFYTCYKDHEETSLNREKEKIIAKALGQDPVQKKQAERIKNFFNSVFSQDAFAWKSITYQPSIFHFSLFVFHFSLFSLPPLTPPPKFA